jgi:nitroimidazol reductase NimA-like FMN-containing flavoprotein (pyridoxamine 5'-phosphate oxidase superfamily)
MEMIRPSRITRPHFPPGYLDRPTVLLEWGQVETRLLNAKNYWLCTVRPDGRPHTVPKWGVWLDGRLFFDGSPETRHARNIAKNPLVSLHLESGDEAVILEGRAREAPRPSPELGPRLAQAYGEKYSRFSYSPQPDQWDGGGLYEILPRVVLAWTKFTEDPTKFVFEADRGPASAREL